MERELIPMAKDQGMTVLAWSPLHNGLLTGKYLPENQSGDSKALRLNSEMMKGFASVDKSGLTSVDESGLRTVREVVAVAKELVSLRPRSPLHGFVIAPSRLSQLSAHENSLNSKTI